MEDHEHPHKTNEEFEKHKREINLENLDKREDAQRRMAWFSLFGMILYPLAVVLAIHFGMVQAAEILGDMAATYFVSVAAIVAAFYGKEAYLAKRDPDRRRPPRE